MSPRHSSGRLPIVLGFQDFLPAHGADSLLVGAALAIIGPHLVNFLATNTALGEFAVRGETGLLCGERLVLVDESATAFCCIPSSCLPRVRGDHFAQFLLAFLAHHFDS